MGYRAVLFAPDGGYVTDYPRDTVEAVWDAVSDGGSRWFFYPLPVVVCDRGMTTPRQRVIDTPRELSQWRGRSLATIAAELSANPDKYVTLYS